MSNRVFGWLTINQVLFVSHLVLVLSIILGLSFTRFQSEWDMRIEHAATMAKTHLSSQVWLDSWSQLRQPDDAIDERKLLSDR
ncbi:hypothetical protein [Vibrio campbellii]|uniref:hypothetical protein n=1 Tax=Vibrio campbellii TaxID=680 RepID=UPI00210D4B31|nr:hypothetical protein [Vibrio campbellii]